jgi:DNA invertase Pin-like site-specific DNA recombinase
VQPGSGRLLFNILASVAEMERELLAAGDKPTRVAKLLGVGLSTF